MNEEFFRLKGLKIIEYNFLKFLSWLARKLPLKISLSIGRGLATLMWIFLPRKRKKIALENIRHCLNVDEKESARIAKISTIHLGNIAMEVLNFPRLQGMR